MNTLLKIRVKIEKNYIRIKYLVKIIQEMREALIEKQFLNQN